MLVIPAPPMILPSSPSLGEGEKATPMRGEKLVYGVYARVEGIPLSPGKTHPVGASGNKVDCRPGTKVSSLFPLSRKGPATSQRRPRFRFTLLLILMLSWPYSPYTLVRASDSW